MNPEMNVTKVVTFYRSARQNSSVEDAATQTIKQLAITPSQLVDAFNAAQLDLSRSDADSKVIHAARNELLSYFKTMEPLTTDETRSIILQATTFNARRQHREAIRVIQDNIKRFDPDLRFNGLKEVMRAAEALDDPALTKTIAKEIAKEFPDLPSIQPYLK